MIVILTLLRAALLGIGKTILFGLLTEKVAVRLIFWALGEVAERTTNGLDDKAIDFLREAYAAGGGTLAQPEPDRAATADPVPVAGADAPAEDVASFLIEQQSVPLRDSR